jgi:hypothetical protein
MFRLLLLHAASGARTALRLLCEFVHLCVSDTTSDTILRWRLAWPKAIENVGFPYKIKWINP